MCSCVVQFVHENKSNVKWISVRWNSCSHSKLVSGKGVGIWGLKMDPITGITKHSIVRGLSLRSGWAIVSFQNAPRPMMMVHIYFDTSISISSMDSHYPGQGEQTWNLQKPAGYITRTTVDPCGATEDASGLTFDGWDPTVNIDSLQMPVELIINPSELRAAGFMSSGNVYPRGWGRGVPQVQARCGNTPAWGYGSQMFHVISGWQHWV